MHAEPVQNARSDRQPEAAGAHFDSMKEMLRTAARRLDMQHTSAAAAFAPRSDQLGILEDVAAFLQDVSEREPSEGEARGRIVLPPRTGKTVIAGHVIAATRLRAVFIVPSIPLVTHAVDLLTAQIPDCRVCAYYSEAPSEPDGDVIVTTYQKLLADQVGGRLPAILRQCALVFLDEAHHSMTPRRQQLLKEVFHRDAVKIALTATPDYSADRMLAVYYPELIHEISVHEAIGFGLLAPMRVWVAEVDVDGSKVRIVAGDYDEGDLGRALSSAPAFEAARWFRYSKANRGIPALICCATRQQAYDLWLYLSAKRPSGRPEPGLVLGNTHPVERKRLLGDYESGKIDTLICVHTLIEGWDSQRCKLLVDLSPSMSLVRAKQKYFRPLTRQGDAEAYVFTILPSGLTRLPIFPTDLLGRSFESYECGELLGRKPRSGKEGQEIRKLSETLIEGVKLKKRILQTTLLEKPKLDPYNLDEIRLVIRSHPGFDFERLIDWSVFRRMTISHPLFTGMGEQLVRFLGQATTREGYERCMARAFPDAVAGRILTIVRHNDDTNHPWERSRLQQECCLLDEAVQYLLTPGFEPKQADQLREAWRTLGGRDSDESVDVLIDLSRGRDLLQQALAGLTPLELRLVRCYLFNEPLKERDPPEGGWTYKALGEYYNLSRERIRQLIIQGMGKLGDRMLQLAKLPPPPLSYGDHLLHAVNH